MTWNDKYKYFQKKIYPRFGKLVRIFNRYVQTLKCKIPGLNFLRIYLHVCIKMSIRRTWNNIYTSASFFYSNNSTLDTTITLPTSHNFWNVHYVAERTRLADKEKSLGLADRLGMLRVNRYKCLPVLEGRDLNNGNRRGFACEIINKGKQVGTRGLCEHTDLISPLTALSWRDCYGIPFEIACTY